jgi:hypothetical protein
MRGEWRGRESVRKMDLANRPLQHLVQDDSTNKPASDALTTEGQLFSYLRFGMQLTAALEKLETYMTLL